MRAPFALLPLVAASVVAACAGQLPGAAPPDPDSIAWLDAERNALERYLGGYPPRFASEQEREEVMKRWSIALKRAVTISNADPENPELLWRSGDLLRQGHNGNVKNTAPMADQALHKCVRISPSHVGCHYAIARLYIASNPKFASQAETHLLQAQALVAPDVHPELELGLAFSYFQQKRRDEALRALDRYIALRPDDTEAIVFKRAIEEGRATTRWSP